MFERRLGALLHTGIFLRLDAAGDERGARAHDRGSGKPLCEIAGEAAVRKTLAPEGTSAHSFHQEPQ